MRILLLSLVCLTADAQAQLTATLEFRDGKTVVVATAAETTEALAALTAAVDRLERPYRFALPAGDPEPGDALTRQVRTFTGDWDSFANLFIRWTAAEPNRKPADQVLSTLESGLYAPLQLLHYTTPLLFEDFPGDGTVSFSVAPPIDPDRVHIELPGVPDAKKRARRIRQLRQWLEPLRGQPWFAGTIRRRLLEFYERLNFAPVFEFDARAACIRITESQRIARIVFPDGAEPGVVRQALYQLVDDRAFRKYRGREAPIGFEPGDRPYWSAAQFQVQQLLLAQAGFEVQAESGGADSVALVVRRITAPRKNEVGGGFDYRPERGFRFLGLGHRAGMGAKLAGNSDPPSGSLSWFRDFLGFRRLHRRLSFEVSGESQLAVNRFLAGQTVNERRTGALARSEFALFRDRAGSGLKLFAEWRAQSVALGTERLPLVSFDLGAIWLYQSRESEYPWRARVEASRGVAFARGKLVAGAHRELPAWFAADVRGQYQWAGDATPLFELPALGGPESVRGFLPDTAVGHRLWSLQSEIWIPVALTPNWARRLKFVTFFDAGAVYSAIASKPGLRSSPGIGARILFHPVVLQFDYSARGKFYFNVTTTLPI